MNKPGPSQLARHVLRNLRDGKPAAEGLARLRARHIPQALAALRSRGFINTNNEPTHAGRHYLKNYE